jgi:hypothetical protein
MHYSQLDLSKINYKYIASPAHIEVKYQNENLTITTPEMTIPFGIDNVYNKYYTKLQFDNYKINMDMESFMNSLMLIEQHIENYLESFVNEDSELTSEFNFKNGYDPTINMKLVSYGTKITTKIMSKGSSDLNYWDVKKNSKVVCKISLNGIWKLKDKFHYKWNILEMKVIN